MDNIKDIKFKTKIKKEEIEDENSSESSRIAEDDFVECLQSLVYKENNPYLESLYEHLLYGKEDKSDGDIFFFSSSE